MCCLEISRGGGYLCSWHPWYLSVSCCLWGPALWSMTLTFDLDPLSRSIFHKSCGMKIVTLTFDLDLLSRSFKVKDPIPAGLGSLWLLFLKVLTLATDVIDFHERSPGLRVFGSVRAASHQKSVLLRLRRQKISSFCAFRFRRSNNKLFEPESLSFMERSKFRIGINYVESHWNVNTYAYHVSRLSRVGKRVQKLSFAGILGWPWPLTLT